MIYDCFLFNQETECLEIRINELKDLNVIHVAVQSNKTFTGILKEVKEYPYGNVIYVKVEDMPDTDDTWQKETHQRNAIMRGLTEAKPDDIIIISDADEIPSAAAIKKYNTSMGLTALVMNQYSYYLNLLQSYQGWKLSRIMPYSYLSDKTPDEVRRSGYENEIPFGGWHYSWMGGVDKILEKFNSFSHTEVNVHPYNDRDNLLRKMSEGESLWSDHKWEFGDIDNTHPRYLQDNIKKFKHLIK